MSRGALIVIDGTDGSGKATQTKLLVNRLRASGLPVETIAFPQYGHPSAGLVEAYLHGEYGTVNEVDARIASIFYAADRFDASFTIRRWIDSGKIVVLDRYVSANMGHQGSKIPDQNEREKFLVWLRDLEYGLFGLPQPDVTVILLVPSAVAQKLATARDGDKIDIHQADPAHLAAAEATYRWLINHEPNCHTIECAPDGELLSREAIAELVWRTVQPQLPSA